MRHPSRIKTRGPTSDAARHGRIPFRPCVFAPGMHGSGPDDRPKFPGLGRHCPPTGKPTVRGHVRFATNCRTVSRASRRWPSAANLECARYSLGFPAVRVLGEPCFQLLSEARPTKLPRHDDHWPGSTNGRGLQVHLVPRRRPSAEPGLLGRTPCHDYSRVWCRGQVPGAGARRWPRTNTLGQFGHVIHRYCCPAATPPPPQPWIAAANPVGQCCGCPWRDVSKCPPTACRS